MKYHYRGHINVISMLWLLMHARCVTLVMMLIDVMNVDNLIKVAKEKFLSINADDIKGI